MPCSMYEGVTSGDFAASDAREAKRQAAEAMAAANKVTDILCRVLRSLPHEILGQMDAEVLGWFMQHKEHDARHGR
jgi:hypothetical protein